MWEYKIIDTGSERKAEKELTKASADGWQLVAFRTGGNSMVYHYVFVLRRQREV